MQESQKQTQSQWLIIISLICIAGLLLRLYLYIQAGFKIDYDEAMIALNARHLLFQGKFEAFVPGQATLANIEAYLLSPFFVLLGPNLIALRIYSLVINAAYIFTSAFLGREIAGKQVGIFAALFAAIAPAYLLVTGSKVWGTTIETMVLGALLFITINRLSQNVQSRNWAILGGLSAGLMFWASWLSFYYLIPATLVIMWKQAKIRQWFPLILICFIIGSLPFWIHNVLNNFESFQTVVGQTQERGVSRLDTTIKLITDQYPTLLTGFSAWANVPQWVSLSITTVYTLGIIALCYHSIRSKNPAGILCVGLIMTASAIYVQSGYGRSSFNSFGVDSTGRYLLMFHTTLPIGIAVLASYLRPRLLQIAIPLLVVGSNLFIAIGINVNWAFDSPYYNRQPDQLETVVDYLLEHEIYFVWTDVGIGQPLMFISEEEILAGDYHDYVVGGIPRFPEALQAVWAAEETAFLVAIIPDQNETPLSIALDQENIPYTTQDFGTLRLYIPSEHVNPDDVLQGLGLQY